MHEVPEDRARTVGMCRRLGVWPLDHRHRDSKSCCCESCFAGKPDELAPLRKRRKPKAFFWEEDAA